MDEWILRHPVRWSLLAAGLVGVVVLGNVGDLRGAGAAMVVTGVVSFVLARPGGVGDRIRADREAEEARRVARGDPVVRLGCAGTMAVVLAIVVAGAVVGSLVMD